MALTPGLAVLTGTSAGLLMLLLGVFVLKAKPRSPLHRAFFALAIADGGSTLAINLRNAVTDDFLQLNLHFAYHVTFSAFVVLLLGFGLLFPRPWGGRRHRRPLLAGLIVAGGALVLAEILSPAFFWSATRAPGGGFAFVNEPPGLFVLAFYALTTAVVVARMSWESTEERSPTRRRQALFVLGGMTLGFAPPVTTVLVSAFVRDPAATFFSSDLPRNLVYWSFLVTLVAVAVAGWRMTRAPRGPERTFVLACLGAVAGFTVAAIAYPDALVVTILRHIALIAYPASVAYAIGRYSVLDIDARVRRAATISLAATAGGIFFAVSENLIENMLEDSISGRAPGLVASFAAAVATAILIAPIVKVSRRVAIRVAPELAHDSLEARRLEIYRHTLEAVLSDGVVEPNEVTAVGRLREKLAITDAEHDAVVRELRTTAAQA